MTEELFIKGIFSLLFGGMFAWMVFDRDSDSGMDNSRRRYLPYISGLVLPMCVPTVLICELVLLDTKSTMQMTLTFCFGVFLHICLYYLLLMPALPFLRQHISARACAVLWMLPNYLYLTQMPYMQLPGPYWVIEAPLALVQVLLAMWAAGFLAVMAWKIISHLVFRARILRNASPVTAPAVLAVWQQEVEAARFRNPKFRLVTSPSIQTPLSVGLFQRSVRVVLPERDYTPGELALILRHELAHVGREDSWNKFFLVFFTAVCWFNPLAWLAMKKSFEDLELSCDETVLLGSDGDTKRQYAGLLLKTAGDEQGFTTCLSASANALRYRLKSVVTPKRKPSGALAVGLVFFLLCMTCGYVTLAYGETTGAEAIYQSQPTEQYVLHSTGMENFICMDEAALHRYLSSQRMEQISGNYSFDQEEPSMSLAFDAPENILDVTLSDRFVRLVWLYGETRVKYYYLPDGTDWDALSEYIVVYPTLSVRLPGVNGSFGRSFTVYPSRVGPAEGVSTEALYEADPREPPDWVSCYPASQAVLSFTLPLCGDCEAEIAPLDGGSGRAVTLDKQSMTLALSEEPSRYTLRGAFAGTDGKLYEVEFQFELGGL